MSKNPLGFYTYDPQKIESGFHFWIEYGFCIKPQKNTTFQRWDKQFLSRSLDQSQQVLTTQSKNVFQVLREEMNSWKEANCTQSNQYPAVTFLTVAWLQKFFIFKHDKAKIKSILNANQCFKLSNFFFQTFWSLFRSYMVIEQVWNKVG